MVLMVRLMVVQIIHWIILHLFQVSLLKFRIFYNPFKDVLGNSLSVETVCPSAQHALSFHYNLHNMYGYFEAKASNM
jgi:hypothetical protein